MEKMMTHLIFCDKFDLISDEYISYYREVLNILSEYWIKSMKEYNFRINVLVHPKTNKNFMTFFLESMNENNVDFIKVADESDNYYDGDALWIFYQTDKHSGETDNIRKKFIESRDIVSIKNIFNIDFKPNPGKFDYEISRLKIPFLNQFNKK